MRLDEDGFKVLYRQALQFDADGKAPLQFGDQVAGFAQVKGT